MSDNEEDWIIPGDWVIREAPTEKYDDEKYIEMFMGGSHKREDRTFTDHAVYVVDCTGHHLTLYSPLSGRTHIYQRDRLPGNWYLATERQVEETWKIAGTVREGDQRFIDMEIKQYPYRKPKKT